MEIIRGIGAFAGNRGGEAEESFIQNLEHPDPATYVGSGKAKACDEVATITGKHFDTINVVGGGSKAGYLNKLTAETTGKTVIAGPSEATALGNIGSQMVANGEVAGLKEFRQLLISEIC